MSPATHRLLAAALLACSAGTTPAGAQDAPVVPSCEETCEQMRDSGDLRQDVSAAECQVRICREQARRLYEKDEFEGALASLDQIHGLAAFSSWYQLERGLVYYALPDFDRALISFNNVMAAKPESVRGAAQRAHTLMRLGRLPEARAQFGQILEFGAADLEFKKLKTRSYVRGMLGVIRLIEEDLSGGKRELKKALQIDGRNRLVRGFLDKVVPGLERGELQYGSLPHLMAAREDLELRKANGALRKLSTVINESPEYMPTYLQAATIQRLYLDFAGCETTLRIAETLFPEATEVFAERIRCTMMRYGIHAPESGPSIAQLKALAAKDPGNPLVEEILLLISQ